MVSFSEAHELAFVTATRAGATWGRAAHQQCRGAVLSIVNTAQVTQVSNLLGYISTVLMSKDLTSYCLDLEE